MDAVEDPSSLVTIERYLHATEAQVAAGRLRAEGIPVYLHSLNHVSLDWLMAIALNGVQLQVPVEFAEEAAAILEGVVERQDDEPQRCAECGSAYSAEQSTAWNASFLALQLLLGVFAPWRKKKRRCRVCASTGSITSEVDRGE